MYVLGESVAHENQVVVKARIRFRSRGSTKRYSPRRRPCPPPWPPPWPPPPEQLEYTRIAASPAIGHLYSQIPHPMHRSWMTTGRCRIRVSPVGSCTSTSSSSIAFSGSGHISSQTMQSCSSAQGRQRFLSIFARPITCCCLSSKGRGGMASTGQT